ncbi:MAG: sulfatase [Chloroflexota bacterium]
MRQKLLAGALTGLFLGLLAAFAEWLHLALFERGVGFQPLLLLYGDLIDGGIGMLLGSIGGAVWAAVGAIRAPRAPAPVVDPSPANQVAIVWRRHGSAPAPAAQPAQHAISRRAALRLGVAAASAGALSMGALAWTTKVQRHAGTVAAYASTISTDGFPDERTNVLLVTLDTVRADQLAVYGNPVVKTPALDKLANQGARFDAHFIQEPQTNPSHASMFTGMYPSSSGVRIHMVDKLPSNLQTLATVFGDAGYYTAGLYSWMSFDPQYCEFQRGFNLYQNVAGDMPGALNNGVVRRAAADFRVAEQYLAVAKQVSDAAGVQQQMEWKNKGRADVTTDAAIAQLQIMERPFFLWVHYFDPHYPYAPPPPYDTQYDPNYQGKLTFDIDTIQNIEKGKIQPTPEDVKRLMSLYQGEISFLDGHLGRLFTAVDTLGLSDKTMLAVTADHGESFGEHSTFKEDTDYFHPHDMYNTEQRTPLLLRYPGHIKPSTVIQAPSQAIDLFSTLLDYANLSVPAQNQGSSLLQLVDGTDTGANRAAFGSMPDFVFTTVAVPGWKLIQNNASGSRELYDLKADMTESHDVAAAHPDVTKQLAGQLQSWMKAAKVS